MQRRAELLGKLVRYDGSPAPILSELREMGWDWNGEPLLLLTKEHFLGVMDRYLAGSISAQELEEWAESLEQREDVAFSVEDEASWMRRSSAWRIRRSIWASPKRASVAYEGSYLRPNNAFKPTSLRGPAQAAGKACHLAHPAPRCGLT
jgi:hypothetical protein